MLLESVITCPHCATAKAEAMPTDACQFFYVCTGCGCPPIQAERSGEAGMAPCCAG